jgi:hypothetical protein
MYVVNVLHDVVGDAGYVKEADEPAQKNTRRSEKSRRDAPINHIARLPVHDLDRHGFAGLLSQMAVQAVTRMGKTIDGASTQTRRVGEMGERERERGRDKSEWKTLDVFLSLVSSIAWDKSTERTAMRRKARTCGEYAQCTLTGTPLSWCTKKKN